MTSKNISISRLEPSQIDGVNEFYNFIYSNNRSKEEFEWEFFSAPAGKAIYIIAQDTDTKKIVGIQSAIPITLITADNITILSAKSEDTLVHPDYRGLKIFEQMYELLFALCIEEKIEYIWGFTNAKKPFIRLGFTIPYNHSQSIFVVNPLPSYHYLAALNEKNGIVSNVKIFMLCLFAKTKSLARNWSKKSTDEYTFLVSEKPEVSANNLGTIIDEGFMIDQNSAYVDWRIKNNPYHKVVFQVTAYLKNQVVGTIYFNQHKNGVWYLIDDKYDLNVSQEDRVMLFHHAIRLLKKQHKVSLIRTWDFTHNAFGTDEIKVRTEVGFYHLDRGMSFVWKSLKEVDSLNVTDFILSRIASQGVI